MRKTGSRLPIDRGFHPEYCEKAKRLCLLGATEQQIADIFGVSRESLSAWREAHPEFAAAINEGKIEADAEIAYSLYQRAKGFTHKAVKVFLPKGATTVEEAVIVPYEEYIPPDFNSISLWLRNRQKELWRDRPGEAGTGGNSALLDEVRELLAGSDGALALVMRAPEKATADRPMLDITPMPVDPGVAPPANEEGAEPPVSAGDPTP